MKKRLLAGIVIVLALALPQAAHAQQTPLPTIIVFESSVESVTVDEAEAGAVTTTLSWRTAGVVAPYRLTLHFYHLNNWEPVFAESSVPLEPNGSRVVTINHPLNFGPPTYLLSIVDGQSRIVDQRTVRVRYDTSGEGTDTTIETFTADVQQLDANVLALGQARVIVTWAVTNRPPTSNLVFEQVFSDGSAVSVELPRPYLWIPSSAQGPVAPIYREGQTAVELRLRVVDLVTEETYVEETLTIGVTGTATVPPAIVTVTPAPAFPTPSAGGIVPGTPQILSFKAAPDTVNVGAPVTLSWEVVGTNSVTIEQHLPNSTSAWVVVNAQSPKGTATVYLPDIAAYGVTFTLWTANRELYATAQVNVHCPYTFFFGAGDGCPATPPLEINAAYQLFEGGLMIWRSDTREIYVLYDDGEFQNGSAAYFIEGNYANLPDPPGDLQPPLNRLVPGSGFGKVWANAPGVRDKLGWALGPEQGYTMTLQQVSIYRDPPPQYLFYFTLPDGSTVGTGSGVWQTVG